MVIVNGFKWWNKWCCKVNLYRWNKKMLCISKREEGCVEIVFSVLWFLYKCWNFLVELFREVRGFFGY